MNLPSFLWLWRSAAWSMGFAVLAYLLLGITGWMLYRQEEEQENPQPKWLKPFHNITGIILVGLVLFLLAIGIVGTLGHFGTLGHSAHLPAGLAVVGLVLLSAGSALMITPERAWLRSIHVGTNIALFVGLAWVSITGWVVVQKYLP